MKSYFRVGINDYAATPQSEKVLAINGAWHRNARFPLPDNIANGLTNDLDLLFRAINGTVDVNGPQHILVGGKGAGAGKSYLLNEFKRIFESVHQHEDSGLVVTAPTGLAAQAVGGQTVHAALGLGLAQKGAKQHWSELMRMNDHTRTTNRTWRFLTKTKIWVIDEISMVDPELMNLIDFLFQKARHSTLPFGGVTLIMFGDFLQLPPVVKQERLAEAPRYIFQTSVWDCMNVCRMKLDRNYRQKDAKFIQLLEEVRYGELTPESASLLQSRLNVPTKKRARDPNDAQRQRDALFAKVAKTEAARKARLEDESQRAKREYWEKEAQCPPSFPVLEPCEASVPLADESSSSLIPPIEPPIDQPPNESLIEPPGYESSIAPPVPHEPDPPAYDEKYDVYELEPLTIFSRVSNVNTKNHTKLMELGKFNVIEKFKPRYGYMQHSENKPISKADEKIAINFHNNPNQMEKTFPVLELSCCVGAQIMLRCNSYSPMGLVNGSMGLVVSILQDRISVLFKTNDGKFMDRPIAISRHLFRHNVSETADVTVSQFPLSLAWAMTIHKVQGMTLRDLEIAGGDCFETGQFYTAISRAPTLDDFTLLNFDPRSIRVDKDAVYFERLDEDVDDD